MKVLIVDDEILVRKGLVTTIPWAPLGFTQIFESSNGKDALAIAIKENPDLIITDIRMPQMDGLELIENIRNNGVRSIIICLSCLNDAEHIRQAMRFDGAIDYIPKLSMTSEELSDVIRQAFAKKPTHDINKDTIQLEERMLNFEQRFLIAEFLQQNDIDKMLDELDNLLASSSKLAFRDCILPEILSLYAPIYQELQQNIYAVTINHQPISQYIKNINLSYVKEAGHIVATRIFNQYNEYLQKKYGCEIALTIIYLYQNYQLCISQEDVANSIHLNSSYFSKYFKKKTGQSYTNFLNNLRITKACLFLKESSCSIAEISDRVGFTNETYFSRLFKNTIGYSPIAYRKLELSSKMNSSSKKDK